jgi:hypothetical protein
VAYELYPAGPSATARQALAGFDVTTTRQGSTVVVTVDVLGAGQPPQRRVYPASDRVYFLEANFGDDSGNAEYNLGDDGLIVTDATGRIVE